MYKNKRNIGRAEIAVGINVLYYTGTESSIEDAKFFLRTQPYLKWQIDQIAVEHGERKIFLKNADGKRSAKVHPKQYVLKTALGEVWTMRQKEFDQLFRFVRGGVK